MMFQSNDPLATDSLTEPEFEQSEDYRTIPAGIAAQVDRLYSRESMLEWGRTLGIDLENPSDLAPAAALGLSMLLWRGTELEKTHTGTAIQSLTEPFTDARDKKSMEEMITRMTKQRLAVLDSELSELTEVADLLEMPRIAGIVEGGGLGLGLPDDVMLRATCSTIRDVLDSLAGSLHGLAFNPAMPVSVFLADVVNVLRDPLRPVTIGCCVVPAMVLLGNKPVALRPPGWDLYLEDLEVNAIRIEARAEFMGAERTLWWLALCGASEGSGLYPLPEWTDGLKDVDVRASGDADEFNYVLRHTPWLLNGAQAIMLASDPSTREAIKKAVSAERSRRQVELMEPGDRSLFNVFLAGW